MRRLGARLRLTTLLAAALVVPALVAGCGGSSGDQGGGGGAAITVAGDVHGFYGELETILTQFPYQHWYVTCVIGEAKKILGPNGLHELESLPAAKREQKAPRIVAEAQPGCEKTGRPTIDPNASGEEIELLRQSSIPGAVELAEANGMSATQVECVESFYDKLSDKQVIELHNGTAKAREGILVSVFRPCAQLK